MFPTIQKILLNFEPEKENFLPAVKEVNKVFEYVSRENIYKIADYFSMSPSEAFSALSFYDDIRIEPKSDVEIKVCMSAPCAMRGSSRVLQEIERFLGKRADKDKTKKLEIITTSCQGRCQRGPVVIINGNIYENVKAFEVDDLIGGYFEK